MENEVLFLLLLSCFLVKKSSVNVNFIRTDDYEKCEFFFGKGIYFCKEWVSVTIQMQLLNIKGGHMCAWPTNKIKRQRNNSSQSGFVCVWEMAFNPVSRWRLRSSLSHRSLVMKDGRFPDISAFRSGTDSNGLCLTSAWAVATLSKRPCYQVPVGQERRNSKMIFNDLCAVTPPRGPMGSIPAQHQTAVDLELNIDSSQSAMSWDSTVLPPFFNWKQQLTSK